MLSIDAKFWGVVVMGGAVVILFFLPWLDRSPVRSIRYKGWMSKTALSMFVISFIGLGYLGTQPPSDAKMLLAQLFSFIYFSFFILMPVYSKLDKTKPEPDRVTF